MAWWTLFSRKAREPYREAFRLYSADGRRAVEVRERCGGQAYYVDRIWPEGSRFSKLRSGEEIGPFESVGTAEAAAVSRPWFRGKPDLD